jgi:lipopolysaccharide export system protein LptC
MSHGTIALAVVLAIAAAATGIFLLRLGGTADTSKPAIEGTDFGYYLLGASLVGLDSNGHEVYTLHADRIEQLPADGSVSMQQVTVDYAPDSDTPWTATANTGRIPASGDPIELEGDVHLARAGQEDAERVEIDTARLEIAVRDKIARTEEPVSVVKGRSVLRATGLEADLSNERLRLGASVRARFQGST